MTDPTTTLAAFGLYLFTLVALGTLAQRLPVALDFSDMFDRWHSRD